jgi:hypothetical protein
VIIWGKIDPELLEPQFRKDIEDLLAPSQWTWYILYGRRTREQQQALYDKYLAGGPKAAPPGMSPHEYGLAVDIVPDNDPEKSGLQPQWNISNPAWEWLFEMVHRHPRLHSGKSFNDADHIERFHWKEHVA